jgi:hypothetical protein
VFLVLVCWCVLVCCCGGVCSVGDMCTCVEGVSISFGVVAQMVERVLSMHEVQGSIPCYSTFSPIRGLIITSRPFTEQLLFLALANGLSAMAFVHHRVVMRSHAPSYTPPMCVLTVCTCLQYVVHIQYSSCPIRKHQDARFCKRDDSPTSPYHIEEEGVVDV